MITGRDTAGEEGASRPRRKLQLSLLPDDKVDRDTTVDDGSANVGGASSSAVWQKRYLHRWCQLRSIRKSLLVFLALGALCLGIQKLVIFRIHQASEPPKSLSNMPCVRFAQFVLQSDHRTHSYGGELYLQAARTSFAFLPGSRTLSIDALGTRGSIRFILDEQRGNEDRSSGQKITVDVTAFSDNWLRFEKIAKLCQTAPYMTEAGYMSEGVLISVDPGELPTDRTVFDITVRLPFPTSASSHGILLPNISASLLGFDFHVDRMNDRVSFDSLFLRSMDRPIHVESLRAKSVQVQNWNGEITGSFTATDRIDLYAHNAAVTVNASLVADRPDVRSSRLQSAATPTLLVTTVYGAINASVSLLTRSTNEHATPDVLRTAYKTIFHTSKAPLTVTYPSAPESHNLTLFTSNSHALTTLRLPTSFTGSLALRSQGPPHQRPHRPPIVHFDQGSDKHGRSLHVSSTSDNLVMARVLPGGSDGVRPAGGLVDVQTIDGDLDLLL